MKLRKFKLAHNFNKKQRQRFNTLARHVDQFNVMLNKDQQQFVLRGGDLLRLGKSYEGEDINGKGHFSREYETNTRVQVGTNRCIKQKACVAVKDMEKCKLKRNCKVLSDQCVPKSKEDAEFNPYYLGACKVKYLTPDERDAFELVVCNGTLKYKPELKEKRCEIRQAIIDHYSSQNNVTPTDDLPNDLKIAKTKQLESNKTKKEELAKNLVKLQKTYSTATLDVKVLQKLLKQEKSRSGLFKLPRQKVVKLLETLIQNVDEPTLNNNWKSLYVTDDLLEYGQLPFEFIYVATKVEEEVKVYCVRIPRDLFAGSFHHSSLVGLPNDEMLKTGAVFCAGNMYFSHGAVNTIDNSSGHFKPPEENLREFMNYLLKDKKLNPYIQFTVHDELGNSPINLPSSESLVDESDIATLKLTDKFELKQINEICKFCNPQIYEKCGLGELYKCRARMKWTGKFRKEPIYGGWDNAEGVFWPDFVNIKDIVWKNNYKEMYKKCWSKRK